MDRHETGMKRITEILGDIVNDTIKKFDKVSPDFSNNIVDFVYGEVYTRPGISDKTRELIAVSSMISQGNTGLPLKAHLKGMLRAGWTEEEIKETIIFIAVYAGFPNAVNAIVTAEDVFAEMK